MKIKVDNKDKLFLIAAIVGFIAFFLPWIGGGFIGLYSGYDLLSNSKKMGVDNYWLLYLLPTAFLIIALAKLQIIENINPILIKIIELIPILLIITSLMNFVETLGIRLKYLDELDSQFLEIFKIGFSLTMLSSIVLIFSPLSKPLSNLQEIGNEGDSPEKVYYQKTSKELGKYLTNTGLKLSSSVKGLFFWLKDNPKILYLTGVLIIVLIAIWLIFIKHYPKRDAKKLAVELCECYTTFEEETEQSYKDYLNNFGNQNFIKRNDARSNLNSITNPINSKKYECVELVNNKYESLKNKFDYKDRSKFEFAYLENQNNCGNKDKPKIAALYSEIEKKIETIKDPEPDVNKIKEDLIGKKIPGWNFDYLSEFKEAEIMNITKGNDRIEYKIFFKLYSENSKSEHDCEVIAIYRRDYYGWSFDNVNMNYITYINTFYSDKWTQITPMKNCRWNAENNYKMSWKTSNWSYARETITGPNLRNKTLPNSNSYYIKSLENKEIKVKFTYRPN